MFKILRHLRANPCPQSEFVLVNREIPIDQKISVPSVSQW